jgi:c-di-GMP-binding flagellar brake protein YcgR
MESEEKAAELVTGVENRRIVPRHGVDEDASLLLINNGSTVSCRIVDLSLGGCCLRTKEQFKSGSKARVEATFRVRGLVFRFSGITSWTDSRHQVGIRFVDVPLRRREELVEALAEVAAENAAKAAREAERKETRQTPVQIPSLSIVARARPLTGALPASQAKPRNRREESREEVDTSAVIHLINVASRLQGRILDLSLGGCRIRTDERFPVGIYTRVETEFRVKGLPFRLGGVVQAIHDRERRNVGIRFLDISDRKREQVEQLIEDFREMRERDQGTGNREPGTG